MEACQCQRDNLDKAVPGTNFLVALPGRCGAEFHDEGVCHTCTRRGDVPAPVELEN
jgi:hypothetical protein